MARKIILSSIELTGNGSIALTLAKALVDGDQTSVQDYIRRIIEPNQAPETHIADLNDYFAQLGYPALDPEDVQTILHQREVAEANPNMVARAAAWVAQQAALQPQGAADA